MLNSSFRPAADIFSELNRLQGVLDQMFRPAERSSIRALTGASFPVINVGTTPDTIEVMALAPGIDPASIQLSVDRGLLVIAGERKSDLPEAGDNISVYAQERFAGNFRRVVSLPDDADPAKVDASLRDGILTGASSRRAVNSTPRASRPASRMGCCGSPSPSWRKPSPGASKYASPEPVPVPCRLLGLRKKCTRRPQAGARGGKVRAIIAKAVWRWQGDRSWPSKRSWWKTTSRYARA